MSRTSKAGVTMVATTGVVAKVISRSSGQDAGSPFRVMVSPSGNYGEHVDVTHRVVSGIAHALWEVRGGDAVANWLDAEAVLAQLVGSHATDAQSGAAPVAKPVNSPVRVPAAEPKAKSSTSGGKRSATTRR